MYKNEVFYIIFEIIFAIFIIIFGYHIWDGFDQTDYNIAKYYDTTKEVDLIYESNFDNGYIGDNIVVSVHNISDKLNNKNVIFKLNKNTNINNIIINENFYSLKDNYISSDDNYNYYLIENISLKGYETKVYYINLNDNNVFDYEFITDI